MPIIPSPPTFSADDLTTNEINTAFADVCSAVNSLEETVNEFVPALFAIPSGKQYRVFADEIALDGSGDATVTFGFTYAAAPIVVATLVHASNHGASVHTVTTTGCEVHGAVASGTVHVVAHGYVTP